jgi:hypothetical protein
MGSLHEQPFPDVLSLFSVRGVQLREANFRIFHSSQRLIIKLGFKCQIYNSPQLNPPYSICFPRQAPLQLTIQSRII